MRIDAVGNRDVHEPIFARQWHGRFGAIACQRKQAGSLPAAHDDGKHVAGIGRHTRAVRHTEILSCGLMSLLYPAEALKGKQQPASGRPDELADPDVNLARIRAVRIPMRHQPWFDLCAAS